VTQQECIESLREYLTEEPSGVFKLDSDDVAVHVQPAKFPCSNTDHWVEFIVTDPDAMIIQSMPLEGHQPTPDYDAKYMERIPWIKLKEFAARSTEAGPEFAEG
jgi:hypothetical protein